MSTSPETVGVIDVGSNTIKLLIAKAGKATPAEKVDFIVEEVRIGEGMTGSPPEIDAQAIEAGAAAIKRLVDAADVARCSVLCIVATSAVREANNKQAFVNAVEQLCGHELRILSGEEEANLIGSALACDPQLSHLDSYYLIDLGGGSLECIHFSNRITRQAESLRLGSVRLAGLLLKDRLSPLPAAEEQSIRDFVQATWRSSNFLLNSSPPEVAILTGGAAKHLAANLSDKQLNAGLSLADFASLRRSICALEAPLRSKQFEIPSSRADIFPTAMVTIEESLRHLGCDILYFTDYNLRFGVAATLLSHGHLPDSPEPTKA